MQGGGQLADVREPAVLGRVLGARHEVRSLAVQPDDRLGLVPQGPGRALRRGDARPAVPQLLALGDLQQELIVPAGRDSDVLRFGLRTMAGGLHTVTVRAFHGGSFLGELRVLVSVRATHAP